MSNLTFKKYSSIKNSYDNKFIKRVIEHNPNIKKETFILTEKIDGSNIQIIFNPEGKYAIGKRNSLIKPDENFNDIWNVLKKYNNELKIIQNWVDRNEIPIRIYGEIFGHGIMKRIDYGEDKYILFFDIEKNNEIIPQKEFFKFFDEIKLSYMTVPIISKINGIDNALNFNVENIKSKILNKEYNFIEGVVIKPYNNVYHDYHGIIFYLKKKTEKFAEVSKSKHIKKDKPIMRNEVENIKSIFNTYINENRVKSIFSKVGEIQDMSEIGKYIPLVIKDAKNDFISDYGFDDNKFDKKEIKYIFNAGSKVVDILKNSLRK